MGRLLAIISVMSGILVILWGFGYNVADQPHYDGTNPAWFAWMVCIGFFIFVFYVFIGSKGQ